MSGIYFYLLTPQSTVDLPLVCEISGARAIGGFVEIQHKRTIINPKISFLNGERKYCLSTKDPTLPLSRPINWRSRWAYFDYDGTLYAYAENSDGIESLLNAKISSASEVDYFNAATLYISKDEKSVGMKSVGTANIRFSKCKGKLSECNEDLKSALSGLAQNR